MEKNVRCPREGCQGLRDGKEHKSVIKKGFFKKGVEPCGLLRVQRYACTLCDLLFSDQTSEPTYRQLKPHINEGVRGDLCHGLSMRSIALRHRVNIKTVARKLVFLAGQAREANAAWRQARTSPRVIYFDEVETCEATKAKPLSIFLFVTEKYEILLAPVAKRPAKGTLAKKSRSKYGPLPNERGRVLAEALGSLEHFSSGKKGTGLEFHTDRDPLYTRAVSKIFPCAAHRTFKGRKPRPQGLGELKTGAFDPLFPLNQRAARMRDLVKRLARKTWCISKRAERLADHLEVFIHYHNARLLPKPKHTSKKASLSP
jgi:hypothetical protein